MLASNLAELAQSWYLGLEDGLKRDYTLLKGAFVKTFVEYRFKTGELASIHNLTMTNPDQWYEFEKKFIKRMDQMSIKSEEQKILLFMDALPEHIRIQLKPYQRKYESVWQYMTMARRFQEMFYPETKSNSIQSDGEIQGPKNKKDIELKNQGNNDSSSQVNNPNTESLEVYSVQNLSTASTNNPKKKQQSKHNKKVQKTLMPCVC